MRYVCTKILMTDLLLLQLIFVISLRIAAAAASKDISPYDCAKKDSALSFVLFTKQTVKKAHRYTAATITKVKFQNTMVGIIVPDYNQKPSDPKLLCIKTAIICAGNYNVIILDWSQMASPKYSESVDVLRTVARTVATVLLAMKKQAGLELDNTYLIGYSLGAHLSGFIGKEVQRMTEGLTVGRITGLDPANRSFRDKAATCRLDKGDALFVDVIHTSGDKLGTPEPIGHADFYVNGGISAQPGCENDEDGSCSHQRVLDYYKESISSTHFKAYSCFDKCGVTTMGFHCATNVNGIYCISTNSCRPFARQ